MTQHELIKQYILDNGSITPAKLCGNVYYDTMCGSDLPKRCRELRDKGILSEVKEGKFSKFFLIDQDTKELPLAYKVVVDVNCNLQDKML